MGERFSSEKQISTEQTQVQPYEVNPYGYLLSILGENNSVIYRGFHPVSNKALEITVQKGKHPSGNLKDPFVAIKISHVHGKEKEYVEGSVIDQSGRKWHTSKLLEPYIGTVRRPKLFHVPPEEAANQAYEEAVKAAKFVNYFLPKNTDNK